MKNEKFEEYFLKYKDLIVRLVMDKTGDYHAAQEICQQVFIAFYKNMDHVPEEYVKAWLLRCTRNAVVDYFRKAKHRRDEVSLEVSVSEEGNTLIEESLEIYEDQRSKSELIHRILKEVREVNKHWYDAIILCCVEGLPYPEVAERLHISLVVLRARVHRARMYIKERYKDEYPPK